MKEERIITLKTNNSAGEIMDFIMAINKTNNLTALVLPELDGQNQIEIEVCKITE